MYMIAAGVISRAIRAQTKVRPCVLGALARWVQVTAIVYINTVVRSISY